MRAQDQVIHQMRLAAEQNEKDHEALMKELLQTKRVERQTKEDLEQARIDRSINVEEYIRSNKSLLGKFTGRSGHITGQVNMQSKFMDFNKIKRKYGDRLAQVER